MEETELEEGEAYDYHDHDDDGEIIDPDVDLSYIGDCQHSAVPSAVISSVKHASASTSSGHLPAMVPATVDPVLIGESWVACDKCSKWRLLPPDINSDDLPKYWLCSMFHYVPGLNRCNISEDETTNIVRGLYQIPAPDKQNNLQIQSNGSCCSSTFARCTESHGSNEPSDDTTNIVRGLYQIPAPEKQNNLQIQSNGSCCSSTFARCTESHGSKEPSDATSSMGNMLTQPISKQ